jgi:serine/threonine protein kinase
MFKIGNSKELPKIPDTLSPEGKDFVRACLQRDPNRRPTAQQLLEHPFVKNLQDDRFDDPDDVAAASSGINNLVRMLAHLGLRSALS